MKVLIQFEKRDLFFQEPEEIIQADREEEVADCFERLEAALKRGYYLAGFFSYEAGYAFEEKLRQNKRYDFPLLCFGVFKQPHNRLEPRLSVSGSNRPAKTDNLSFTDYRQRINSIKDHIAQGDVYQITYCIKNKFETRGDPFALYSRLLREQPVPYPAYLETADHQILSLSPEMFIKKTGDKVTTKPMKGTWPRGRNYWEDLWAGWRLHLDPKNRAENVMIADLLRNDLGRIGREVRTPKLFEVAKYTTLCQMTSTVTARVEQNIPLFKLFKAIHPSGSVTGAPKIRAMEIINELETAERKIYTGAIGYITPDKDLFFNVPIRTLLIDKASGRGEMGVGGGIVWDSTAAGEWEECQLKSRFLFAR